MKIVHISTIHGGAGIAALRLHQRLMKQPGIESGFVQRFPLSPEYAQANNIFTVGTGRSLIIRALKKYNLHTEHFQYVKLHKHPKDYEIATFATSSYRLEQLPIIKDADIIHLHWVSDILNFPTFFKNVKQPIVWTLHDINPFSGMFHFESDRLKNLKAFGKLDEQIKRIKVKAINKKDDIHIVCLSEWMKEKSEASPAFRRYPHYLIPNGLDFSNYPVIDRLKAKERIGLGKDRKTLLIVGTRLDNIQKGFPLFIETINKLDRKDFQIISVGASDENLKIRSDIRHTHFENIKEVSELNNLYAAADLTVIPSYEDNLPNVMLESFANSTPVMSFSNGGMAEHIRTGENGILINKIGTEPLTQALNDFLDNKYIFDKEKIRNYATENFSETLQTERYLHLYKDILNK